MDPGGPDPSIEKPKVKLVDGFTEGNITLVSEDGFGFKVEDFHLRSRSEVFRTMLAGGPCSCQEIILPDTKQHPLAIFTRALLDDPIRHVQVWQDVLSALQICKVYECPATARTILQAYAQQSVPASLLESVLKQAAYHDDRLSASLILRQGHKSIPGRYSSMDEGYASPALEPPRDLVVENLDHLPKRWIYALLIADRDAEHLYRVTEEGIQSVEYWGTVADLFLERLKTVR